MVALVASVASVALVETFDLAPHSIQAIDTLGYPLPVYSQEGSKTFSTTNTESVTFYNNINIYPNPASDYLMLELGSLYGEYIEVFDNLGQKRQEQTLNQRGTVQVPVNSLSTGLYMIKIKTEKGKSKIFNTLNIPVKTESDVTYHLSAHTNNIKSYKLSNCK